MGIWGLQKFMETKCKGGFESISISEIAQLYRCETGEKPVILCELSSCITDLTSDSLKSLQCRELKKFQKNVATFINNFFELGITLKVVADGFRRSDKLESWIEKMKKRIIDLKTVFSNKSLGTGQHGRYDVLIMYLVANMAFQTSNKCEYIRAVHTADEYIINYVKKFNCFAILTNDSNFIFAEGAKYCLSSRHLDLTTMTTYNYNRNNLAKYFKISTSQLPLFGSLLVSRVSGSRSFISNLRTKEFNKMLEIVKQFPSGEKILQENEQSCKKILGMIVDDSLKWKKCLKFFCGSSEPDLAKTNNENWDEILSVAESRHAKGVTSVIYEVLSQKRVCLSPDFANVLKPMPDSALLPLRQQLYGILFFEYPDKECSITEHCFEYCEKMGRAKYICKTVEFQRTSTLYKSRHCRFHFFDGIADAVQCDFSGELSSHLYLFKCESQDNHIGLLKMWCPLSNVNIQEEKRRIFFQAIDKKLNPDDIKDVEEELLFPFLAIFYLRWKSEIKIEEFDAKVLLIHAILVNSLSEEDADKYMLNDNITSYVFHLSSWFVKTVNHLNFLNYASGEPFCLHKTNLVNFFDGKILHHVYKREKDKKFEMKDLKVYSENLSQKFLFLDCKLCQIALECGLNLEK